MKKVYVMLAVALAVVFSVVVAVPQGSCAVTPFVGSTDSIGDAIQEWMPTIVQFAMLAMILGMLKKFSGDRR